MIGVSAQIGGETGFKLEQAVLIYGDGTRSYATLHDPIPAPDRGAPYLGPARPLGAAFLKTLAKGLGASVPAEVLPPEVLVRTSDVTVWWRPASVAPLFYNVDRSPEVQALSGKTVPHPPLVFRASGRELWVRALGKNERPIATTPMFAAPYYNVGVSGSVCTGTMRIPHGRGLETLAQWEASFFGSEFTHPLPGARLTAVPAGFASMWGDLAAIGATEFPAHYLARAAKKQTLGGFVTSDGGRDW